MKVTSNTTYIEGRGRLITIDALPAELQPGMRVRRGHRRWEVYGIETHAMPREHTNGRPAGLLIGDPPEIGDELEIDPFDQLALAALLTVEWSVSGLEDHRQCPDCDGFDPSDLKPNDRPYYALRAGHRYCSIDAALVAAGLDTQEKRSAARTRLRRQGGL